jgi:hypothetical protein
MSALPVGRKRRSPFKVISDWWLNWTGFDPAFSDLSCCAQDEVDRIARDVGVSAAELRTLARLGPDAADPLLRRMAALGLDQNEVFQTEPRTFQDLQRICSMCDSHKRCAHDIAQNSADPVWEDYCPNAATLKALNAMRSSRAA